MILTDSGILIRFLRKKDVKIGNLLRTLPVAICGVVQAEILAGARGIQSRAKMMAFLQPFQYVPMPDSMWEPLGDNLSAFNANGLTVPFPDAVVATLGIENDIEVWASDPHYAMMQKILPALKLFQEPPSW